MDEAKTDEAKTDEAKTDEAKTDEAKTDEAKTDEAKTDEAKTDEAKTDEAKTDEAKTDEAKTDEAKTGEAKTGEAKAKKKVWFVTGASSGFGREIVEAAQRRGDLVVATARDTSSLADVAKREGALVVRLDVTKAVEIETAVRAAMDRFGRVDVLVNNAGFSILGAVEETSDTALRETMETMFFGAVALTRAVIPSMRARGGGTIVQITSVGGITTAPGFGAYCAAKHALEGLSECMQKELAAHGVRVLLVEPGAFRTALFGAAFRHLPALDAYAGTVGGVRSWVQANAGVQAGDPKKAARAIVDAVDAPPTLLRLPLGPDAVSGIREKLAFIAADVDRAEAVALSTDL